MVNNARVVCSVFLHVCFGKLCVCLGMGLGQSAPLGAKASRKVVRFLNFLLKYQTGD